MKSFKRIFVSLVWAFVSLIVLGVLAFISISQLQAFRAAQDAAFVKAHVVPGMMRSEAYRLLRSHGLSTEDNGARNRPIVISIPGATNVACGWWTTIAITFNDHDRVDAVRIGGPVPICM